MIQADRLSPVDEAILDELQDGARTKGYLVDATGYHRNTIGTHLTQLDYAGAIDCLHDATALYELTKDPRETDR